MKPDGTDYDPFFLPEDNSGSIVLQTGGILELACPGSSLILDSNDMEAVNTTATCVSGTFFQVDEEVYDFSTISCADYPEHTARYSGNVCEEQYKEIEIGFEYYSRFLLHISLCFDDVEQNTLYAWYNLTSSIGGSQTGFPRPSSFIQGSFYNVGSQKVNSLYSRAAQRVTINKRLGLDKKSYKYIHETDHYYLARGHLTAKTDFVYGSEQLLTFYFVNAAPQWQTMNNGNWETLETNVRTYASNNKVDLVVYTGTYGITTLPHEETGEEVPLYLYVDENDNVGIPVPHLFWKFVYEPKNKAGAVFVSVNNPYIEEKEVICDDQSDSYDWLTWKKDDQAKGYSYVCTVADFASVVENFPELEVRELLV